MKSKFVKEVLWRVALVIIIIIAIHSCKANAAEATLPITARIIQKEEIQVRAKVVDGVCTDKDVTAECLALILPDAGDEEPQPVITREGLYEETENYQ